jgi:hypothetical protein
MQHYGLTGSERIRCWFESRQAHHALSHLLRFPALPANWPELAGSGSGIPLSEETNDRGRESRLWAAKSRFPETEKALD